MQTILLTVTICCTLYTMHLFRLDLRSDKVADLRRLILQLCSAHARRHGSLEAYQWFYGKHTYDRMLRSLRPLRLEEWYTPDELARINS